ncbi:MAG: hypothetical protein OXE04_00370 [bacterium]|nr:hypothetical protein [bacterium]
MTSTSRIVDGEWENQPHNWKTFFRRWRRSRERFRLEVVRTEAMSAEDFFVIGRATAGRVQEGSRVLVHIAEEPVVSQVLSIDNTTQGHSEDSGEDFQMLLTLKLAGIGPDSGVQPGTIVQQAD